MAKDIMVNEGASLKTIKGVEKLVTKLPDDTTVDWIPEDETLLVTKMIVQDGTYVASQEIGKPYGYSEVTVSGAGEQVIGQTATKNITENGIYRADQDEKGPFYGYSKVVVNVSSYSSGTSGTVGTDSDGDDAMAVVNPETGKIEIEKIPSRIEVIVPPYNPYGAYNNSQTIEKTGMIVMAYTANDEEWGEVLLDEITLNPTIADYDSMSGGSSMTMLRANVPLSADQNCTPSEAAVLAITGGHPIPPGQVIEVSWPRPGDREILKTEFSILVAPPYSIDNQ